ncbi:hypothetical protein BJV78DRAFT_1126965 [Lactifluus subvellereus]|nr:hypothetical protein BJV78DRAFT_1126965 [Lactifluus subvellereus]
MGHVRSYTFCRCIPVRFGVFIMTAIGVVGGLIMAIVGWLSVTHKDRAHLTGNQDISLSISSLSYTVLLIVSIFGLIGVIIRRRDFLTLYSTIALWHLGFGIVTGSFFIYTLFHKIGDQDVSNCVSGSTDPSALDDCKKAFEVVRGFTVGIYIIFWITELWGCLIAAEYVSQLKQDEPLDHPPPALVTASAPRMATTYNYGAKYAFAHPENSFGQPNVNNV